MQDKLNLRSARNKVEKKNFVYTLTTFIEKRFTYMNNLNKNDFCEQKKEKDENSFISNA